MFDVGYRRAAVWLIVGVLVVVVAAMCGAMIGPGGPPWWRVPLAFVERIPGVAVDSGVSEAHWNIIWKIRMPRVVLAGLVGAMLSVGGASYQGIFRNPLVDPYLLGAAAGAGLGATIMIALFRDQRTAWPIDPLPIVAFAFSVGAVAATYAVSTSFGGLSSPNVLVLAGVAMASLLTAAQTFIQQRHNDVLREVYAWIGGRVSSAQWDDVRLAAPYIVVSWLVLVSHRRHLDLLRVGDDEATTLGMPVARIRIVVVVAATLGTAAAVAVSGLIGFVGLVVPHAVRLVVGASYRYIVPMSIAFGAAFLILVDIPGRMLFAPSELPIGVVTAFLGAPFFLLLLRSRGVVR